MYVKKGKKIYKKGEKIYMYIKRKKKYMYVKRNLENRAGSNSNIFLQYTVLPTR